MSASVSNPYRQVSVALLTIFIISGCKIRVEVPEGGSVTSESGVYTCLSGERCDIDVVDIYFDEVFVAKPDPGFRFDKWRRLNRGLCGGSSTSCALSTEGFDGNESLLQFLESPEEIFFLQPVFEPLPGDAFDPVLFEDVRFRTTDEGLQVRYRFKGDGTYSVSAPPLFASGTWEFRADNTVIFFSMLAETDSDDMTGYAVFESFSINDNGYVVCFIRDQSVKSVSAAINTCDNGSASAQTAIWSLED